MARVLRCCGLDGLGGVCFGQQGGVARRLERAVSGELDALVAGEKGAAS